MIIQHPFYTMVLPHPFVQVICSSNLIVGYIVVVVIDNQLVKLYESEYWDFSEFSNLITSTWAPCIGQKRFVSIGFVAARVECKHAVYLEILQPVTITVLVLTPG